MPSDVHTQTLDNEVFGTLPEELVLRIIKLAAQSSRPFCQNLSLVSSFYRRIALRELLDTVVLKSPANVTNFQKLVEQGSGVVYPQVPPADLVHNVWLESDLACAASMISSFRSLTTLSINFNALFFLLQTHFPGPDLSLTVTSLPSHGDFEPILKQIWEATFLDRITRLNLNTVITFDTIYDISIHLPRLTHLAVDFQCIHFGHPAATRILLELLKLEMLVITSQPYMDNFLLVSRIYHMRATDHRVYTWNGASLREDWRNTLNDGDSLWERAVRYTASLQVSNRTTHNFGT